MAIDPDKPHAFLSYTRFDDKFTNGGISWLRQKLEEAVQARTGKPFQIFQDVEDIEYGDRWEKKLDQALAEAQLFIPILTPSFFQSDFCRREAQAFLNYAERTGRDDLILPLYLIETPILDLKELREADELASALSARQHADWRSLEVDLQHEGTRSKMALPIQSLSKAIARAVARNVPPARAEEPVTDVSPPTPKPDEPIVVEADSALFKEFEAAKAKLAELEREREEERRHWREKEEESEKAVEAVLQEAEREQAENAKRLRALTSEKRDLEEKAKTNEAQAKQVDALRVENERLRSIGETSSTEEDASAVTSRWPHRSPLVITASIGLLLGATGTLGVTNFSSSDQTDQLLAELEQLRAERSESEAAARDQVASIRAQLEATQTELTAAQNTIAGLSQQTAAGPSEDGGSFQDCEHCPEMVVIPAGTFTMGSPADEEGRFDREGPQREVTIGSSFAIGKYEVTFEAYDRFAEASGKEKPDDRGWGRGQRPVINVSW
jgi:hypothetical protein